MKESDIRPKELFERYLALARKDAERLLAGAAEFCASPCPACGHEVAAGAFVKLGFGYVECVRCRSLYVSPRPTSDQINSFYRDGESVEFWSTDFFRVTADARRRQIFQPRALLTADIAKSAGTGSLRTVVDVGSGYGIFLEELRSLGMFEEIVGIEPAPSLARICREKGFRVIEKPAEETRPDEIQADVATAFEVVEHLHDPRRFLQAVGTVVRPGGLVIFTTLTVSGFDILALWDRSNSVHPPHHLNLMSLVGIEELVKRSGLEPVSIETPGKLDVDIVRNAIREDPGISLPRFARAIAESTPEVRERFQTFLAENRLSSHIRVVARRP